MNTGYPLLNDHFTGTKWIATHYGGVAVFREGGVDLPSSVSKPAHSKKNTAIFQLDQ